MPSTRDTCIAAFLAAALRPDVDALTEMVLGAVERDGALSVYDELLAPALREVGHRWERDELTVADEHLVTALTEQVLARVRHRAGPGPVAVSACTPGNDHRLGATMVADTLGLAGWSALLLASPTPFDDLVSFASGRDARLVAVSVGVEEELPGLAADLRQLAAQLGGAVPIVVGGGALLRQPDWNAPAGVHVRTTAAGLLDLARDLLPHDGARA